MNSARLSPRTLSILKRYVIPAFAVITLLGVFIPFSPSMPEPELDAAWQYAMNEAVARHMIIGKQIIFTGGPYCSVYTTAYDPATDDLMTLGSLCIGLSYALLVLYAAREVKPWQLIIFLLFLAGFSSSRDALLLSYPLVLAVCAARFLERTGAAGREPDSFRRALATGLLIAPLGLLPLIKGTFLILSGITIAYIFLGLLYRRQTKLAFAVLICPLAASVIFWRLSGQAVANLPGYIKSMAPMISGYTEAMQMGGEHKMEIAVFLVASAALIYSVSTTRKMSPAGKLILGTYMALYLFLAFKSGFVRHDTHAAIAGCSILVGAIIIGMLYLDTNLIIALVLSFLAWFYIDKNSAKTSTDVVFDRLQDVYLGFLHRCPRTHSRRHLLHHQFDRALAGIREALPVPKLQGTVDIYPTDQAALLASENQWDPRPVFQSYTAYTPALAGMNEEHLRGETAPDNILFSVDPIDCRLPSLDDGPSWPALFDNYTLAKTDTDYGLLYLRRNSSVRSASRFSPMDDSVHKTKEYVAIPRMNVPVFAEIDLQPTLLGKALGVIYKDAPLRISVKLRNGKIERYRVVANIMRAGFLISPLVENTADFASLMTGDGECQRRKAVESIMIAPEFGNGTLWRKNYSLKLEAYLTSSH